MSTAEEILKWLCDELDQKSKEVSACGNSIYQAIPWADDLEGSFDQLDELTLELRQLGSEAKQRLKESKQQVAA